MRTLLQRFIHEQNGATAIEYGLLALFIFLAIIASLQALTTKVGNTYNNVAANVSGAM